MLGVVREGACGVPSSGVVCAVPLRMEGDAPVYQATPQSRRLLPA